MTLEELYRDKPRGEVIIHGGELNKTYKAFVCHGCQTCWTVNPDLDPENPDALEESYPHYLFIEEIPNATQPVETPAGVNLPVPPVGD